MLTSMKLGVTLPHYDYSLDQTRPITFDDIAESAKVAEASGFDSAYISDHVTLDIAKYGGPEDPYVSFEPLSTLSALAPLTTSLTLGTLVLCEALRHPVMTASIAHSISKISSGRFTLGLGAGWYEPDYEIYGDDMPGVGDRMTRLTESLQIIQPLLKGENVTFEGRFYSSTNASLTSPLVPGEMTKTPVFLGGKGDRLLRMVARYADGWNTCWAWTPSTYAERVESLYRACEKYDRDPASIHQSLGLYAVVADSHSDLETLFDEIAQLSPPGIADGKTLESWRETHLVGTVEEVAEQLSEYSALGVREMIINPGFAPFHVGKTEIIQQMGQSLSKAVAMADIK
jgi:alkanesulfonate monooxygenase SsuD/methylene tetrahydromethanopterin reductase-like flavin-dependent oxidoreductase (luciferase family)